MRALLLSCLTSLLLLAAVPPALAHCDTMDGPVVAAARQALDTKDPIPALAWVQSRDETAVRAAFEQVQRVRGLGPDARQLADTYFFETVVRLHRAGEGEPYTGLQPAGQPVHPAVAAADRALKSRSGQELLSLLHSHVQAGLETRLHAALAPAPAADLAARRRAAQAYVSLVHFAEQIYDLAIAAPTEESHASH